MATEEDDWEASTAKKRMIVSPLKDRGYPLREQIWPPSLVGIVSGQPMGLPKLPLHSMVPTEEHDLAESQ